MVLAAKVPWAAQSRSLVEREMGAVDPSFLFAWPFARVLAVFFLDAAKPAEAVMTAADKLEWVNRKRAARGEGPLAELPKRK